MKKLLKSKIALAVLTIALVVTAIGAGTYSWFLDSVANGGTVIGNASLEAEKFGLSDTNNAVGQVTELKISKMGTTSDLPINSIPKSKTNTDAYLIFPGEGVRVEIADISTAFGLTTNRSVVVEVDLSNFVASVTDTAFTPVGHDDEVLYTAEVTTGGTAWQNVGYKYYKKVDANTLSDMGSITLEAGIIPTFEKDIDGNILDQNYFMGNVLDFSGGALNNAIKVTAVQDTKEAVEDVFGTGVVTLLGY